MTPTSAQANTTTVGPKLAVENWCTRSASGIAAMTSNSVTEPRMTAVAGDASRSRRDATALVTTPTLSTGVPRAPSQR
jgi:hypothetical protein